MKIYYLDFKSGEALTHIFKLTGKGSRSHKKIEVWVSMIRNISENVLVMRKKYVKMLKPV